MAAYLTAAIGVSQTVGNPLGAMAMKRWSKPAVLVVGLALTALATALVPAVASAVVAFIAVLITVLLAGAVLPPSLAVVGDVAHGHQEMGAATGLIGLFNVVGSMIAPWAFGALLDAYGTAPGDSGYTAGYLMLAGFCAVGALGPSSSSSCCGARSPRPSLCGASRLVVMCPLRRPWSWYPLRSPEAGMRPARDWVRIRYGVCRDSRPTLRSTRSAGSLECLRRGAPASRRLPGES